MDHKRKTGVSRKTIYSDSIRVESVFASDIDQSITAITLAKAKKIWSRYIETPTRTGNPPSVATQRGSLSRVNGLYTFAIKRKLVARNPFADVEILGRVNKGKPQLTIDELRKLLTACFAERSRESLCVAMIALMGLRGHEATQIRRRDVDDGDTVLWVAKNQRKNESSVRRLIIPEDLRSWIAESFDGDGRLFPRREKSWPRRHTHRLCRKAGVPPVCAQGLRATFSTIATGAGVDLSAVQAMLGHRTGSAVTAAHYVQQGALESQDIERTLRVIRGGKLTEVSAETSVRKKSGSGE